MRAAQTKKDAEASFFVVAVQRIAITSWRPERQPEPAR